MIILVTPESLYFIKYREGGENQLFKLFKHKSIMNDLNGKQFEIVKKSNCLKIFSLRIK